MATVFISYRREDKFPTFTVRDNLSQKSDLDIFIDENMAGGQDFKAALAKEIERRDVMLVVIGRGWIAEIDRLKKDDDFVRREISLAIAWKKPIIPVIIEGGRVPRRDELPPELLPMLDRNAREISANKQKENINRLAQDIRKLVRESATDQVWATMNGLRGVLNLTLGAVSGANLSIEEARKITETLAPSFFQDGNLMPELASTKLAEVEPFKFRVVGSADLARPYRLSGIDYSTVQLPLDKTVSIGINPSKSPIVLALYEEYSFDGKQTRVILVVFKTKSTQLDIVDFSDLQGVLQEPQVAVGYRLPFNSIYICDMLSEVVFRHSYKPYQAPGQIDQNAFITLFEEGWLGSRTLNQAEVTQLHDILECEHFKGLTVIHAIERTKRTSL